MRVIIVLLFLFFPFSQTYAREEAPTPAASDEVAIKFITGNQAKKLLAENKSVIVVDVRTPAEFAEKHLVNAANINFFGADFEKDILKLPKDAPIILYCKSGRRSEAATEFLTQQGYANAMSLKNGMAALEDADMKLVGD